MTIVAWISGGMLGFAALLTVVHIVRSATLPDRAIGVDMLVALVLNGLAVSAALTRDGIVEPIILVIGLLGFLGSVTIARYIERRGL